MEIDFNQRDPNGLVRKVVHLNALARDPEKAGKCPAFEHMDIPLINETIQKITA